MGVVAALFMLASRASGPPCIPLHGTGTLALDIRNLAPGTAKLFCYDDSAGKQLRFLLARNSQGKVYASFDACRQCYKHHEGYSAHNGQLVCRMCGNRYPINHMLKGKASCVPVKLPAVEHGNTVDVKVSALKKGRWLF